MATADFGAMWRWGLVSLSPLIDLRKAWKTPMTVSFAETAKGGWGGSSERRESNKERDRQKRKSKRYCTAGGAAETRQMRYNEGAGDAVTESRIHSGGKGPSRWNKGNEGWARGFWRPSNWGGMMTHLHRGCFLVYDKKQREKDCAGSGAPSVGRRW